MSDPVNPEGGAQAPGSPHDRLDSWKKIAAYLKRDVSTVQRWERREQLPVHRQLHEKQGSVYAYRGEIDQWWAARQAQLAQPQGAAVTSGIAGGRAGRWYRSAMARALVAAAVLCSTWVLAWFGLREDSAWKNPLAGARFTRLLPDFSGAEQTAMLSPDGKWLAFVARREEGTDAWLADLDMGTYRNITQGRFRELVNPAVRTLGFSADSALVTVWNRSGDGTQPGDVSIQAAPVGGGPLQPYLGEAAEFDWSRNGKRLVYHTTGPGDPIMVRDSPTAAPRTIYTAPTGVHCHFPAWSPDESYIYFVRGVPPADWDLWRIHPDGSGLESLTQLHSRLSYPVLPDRHTLLYLATDQKGAGPWIYSLDLNRREPHRVSEGLESYSSLAASSDGLKLVATVASERKDLWKVALRDNGPATAPRLDRVLAGAEHPRLGPGFLVYVTQRANGQAIRILEHGTSREVWHHAQPGIIGAPSVSADGLQIAFNLDTGRGMQLIAIDRDGSHPHTIADSLVLQGSPAWRPDGQALVASVVSNGQPQLRQFFLDGRPSVPLVAEYSSDPAWSPGGQFLIYTGADVGTTFPVRAAAPDGRAWPMPALMLTRGGRRLAFLPGSQELVYLGGSLGHKDLWAIDLRHDRKRLLLQLPPDFVASDFDISADGSEAVLERLETSSEIELMERSN